MGTSKTGYTWETLEKIIEFLVRKDILQDEPDREGLLRVCIRVDPAPETMTRGELKKRVRRGWLLKIEDWADNCIYTDHHGEFVDFDEDGQSSQDQVAAITHARPHDGAPWTRIVDEKEGE